MSKLLCRIRYPENRPFSLFPKQKLCCYKWSLTKQVSFHTVIFTLLWIFLVDAFMVMDLSCFYLFRTLSSYPPGPLLLGCSFSLSHSALECLQKASILEYSFPGLNPTSDCFFLSKYWNSPLSKGPSHKLVKTLDKNPAMSVFSSLLLHCCLFSVFPHLQSYRISSLSCSSPSFLLLESGCSFQIQGQLVSLWVIFFSSEVFLSQSFLIQGILNAAVATCSFSSINILQGCSCDFILVTGI